MGACERQERYAQVAVEALGLNVLRAHDRMVADEIAGRFMALADDEQLRAQVSAACRRAGDAEDYAPPTVEDLAREDDEDDHDLRGAQ